ncbi:MAG: ATP-binding protein, partial [Bdellovibrio sp.]|nr:ATP-binding protein [Bdellovibrio sp.]
SETVKKLWDQQKRQKKTKIKILLLGSSSLEIQKNLSESLTGRFELIRAYHWSFEESKDIFKIKFSDYVKYGGYPGSYQFLSDKTRFSQFIKNSIIETVIDKDILKFQHVRSPALFRQTFDLLMSYPAQEISYTKLLGQLQDKGNTDLIKSFIRLFESAFLMKEIKKYSNKAYLEKSSSPKIVPLCNALVSEKYKTDDPDMTGRLYEALVGAELVKCFGEVYYWRQASYEVDYVIEIGTRLYAIEVKSGRKKNSKGLHLFREEFKKAQLVWIDSANIFDFLENPEEFFKKLD